jgi:WD40 repeat protein|nr:protein kinase [Kofleriaceae bacterium]
MSCARAAELDERALAAHVVSCAVCRSHAAIVETLTAAPPTVGLGAHGATPKIELASVDPGLYVKHHELGAGGMGRTYRAFERRLGRVVALKQIRTDTAADASALELLFEREARLTARLQHPSIVAIYEAGKLGDAPFYAMRLIDGVPLDKEIARRKTLAERLALVPHVLTCAHAIAYAHDQRVVHRDLKPANIVIGKFGEAIVIDWGVACDLDEPAAKAKGHSVGTPAYMAPEQAAGEPADASFDIYALGATLYHVLAGAPPLADLPQVVLARDQLVVTPLDKLVGGVPRDLLAIVDKAIAPRADRYATAAQLADDLAHFLAGRLVAAYEYTRRERLVRWLRKHRISVAVAAIASVIVATTSAISVRRIVAAREVAQARADELVLGRARDLLASDPTAALAWLAQYPPDGPDRGEAALIAAEASSLGVARHVLAGNTREVRDVALAPSGSRVASAGADGCVWTYDVVTGDGNQLGCGESPILRVAYSPDGKRLASLAGDGTVALWDGDSGAAITKLSAGPVGHALAWSPDGTRLAAAGDKVRVWADVAAPPVELDVADDVFDIAFSPRGDAIAAGGRAAKVQLWSLAQPAAPPRELTDLADGVMQLKFSPDGSRLAAAGRDQKTHVWLLATGAGTAYDDGWLVRTIAFTPDGRVLASAGEGAVVHVRDLATGATRPFAGHRGAVVDLAFTGDGKQLVSASLDQTLRVWDVASGASRALLGHRDIIDRVVVAADGSLAVSAGKDHAVRVWPLRGEPSEIFAGPPGPAGATTPSVMDVAFPPAGSGAPASAWSDGAIRVGDTVVCASPRAARELAWSPDGASLTWVGHDPVVHSCAVAGGDPNSSRPLSAPDSRAEVFAIAMLPDGRFVTGGIDKTVRLWEPTGESRLLHAHKGGVWSVAVSPDGKRFASGGLDGVLAIGALDGAGAVRRRAGHKNHINAVAFSPDGTRVATASDDETARVWDVDGDGVTTFDVHRTVDAVAFSPDGTQIATAAHDGGVTLWSLAGGAHRVVARHHAAVKTLAFSPDGHMLASGGLDGTVWLVDLEHGAARVYVTAGPVQRVAFSADGTRLAAAAQSVQIWAPSERSVAEPTSARVGDDGEIWTPRRQP